MSPRFALWPSFALLLATLFSINVHAQQEEAPEADPGAGPPAAETEQEPQPAATAEEPTEETDAAETDAAQTDAAETDAAQTDAAQSGAAAEDEPVSGAAMSDEELIGPGAAMSDEELIGPGAEMSDEELIGANPAAGEDVPAEEGSFFDGVEEREPLFSLSRGGFSLGVMGSVQLLAVPFIQDPMASLEAGSVANTEGFRLRRARFGFAGDLPHDFGYRLLFQHGDGGANILDAYVSFEPHPLARMTAGALKVPFSGVMIRSSEYQSFLQRPYAVREIAPDRALGFELSGQHFFFSYAAGIFNGGGDYYRGDNNAGMLYAARFALHILGPPPEGEITQPPGLVFELAGSYYFNQDAGGNQHAVDAELSLRWRRLDIRGEFLWSTFDPAGEPATGEALEYGQTERLGWFAEAGVFIINDHLQVALRYEGQLINEAVDYPDMDDLWAITAAVNGYFLQGRIKLTLQYELRREWTEEQVDNDFLAIQIQGRI